MLEIKINLLCSFESCQIHELFNILIHTEAVKCPRRKKICLWSLSSVVSSILQNMVYLNIMSRAKKMYWSNIMHMPL